MNTEKQMTPDDLRRFMSEMNYTRDKAASALGVGRRTLGDWLDGKSKISLQTSLACAALKNNIKPYHLNQDK